MVVGFFRDSHGPGCSHRGSRNHMATPAWGTVLGGARGGQGEARQGPSRQADGKVFLRSFDRTWGRLGEARAGGYVDPGWGRGQPEPRWGLRGQSSFTASGLCARAGRQGSWPGVVRREALPPQAHPKGPAKSPGEEESMTEHDGLFILAPKRTGSFQQISKPRPGQRPHGEAKCNFKTRGRKRRIWGGGPFVLVRGRI